MCHCTNILTESRVLSQCQAHTQARRPRPKSRPRLLPRFWCGSTSSWSILEVRPKSTKWFVVSRIKKEDSQVIPKASSFPQWWIQYSRALHKLTLKLVFSNQYQKSGRAVPFLASIKSLAGLAKVFLYLSGFCFSIHKARMGQVRCLMFVAAGGESGNQCGVGRMK